MEDNAKKQPVGGTFSRLMSGVSQSQPTSPTSVPQNDPLKESKKVIKQEKKQESNKEINKESNITILQLFTDEDIKQLREPAYTAQTYRLRDEDIDIVKDLSHTLSKELDRRKVSQTDIVRIAFHLFDRLWKEDKRGMKELLEKIKQ